MVLGVAFRHNGRPYQRESYPYNIGLQARIFKFGTKIFWEIRSFKKTEGI
jgi:hypothetical protein